MKTNKSVKMLEQVYETYKGNPARQIRELKKYIVEGKKTGNTVLIGAAYFHIGYIYYELGDRDGVFTNALKAVAMLKDSGNVILLVRAYVMLGYGYSRQENYQMELDCYDKAYALARKHRLKGVVFNTLLNNLSNCYHHMGDYKAAIQLISEAISRVKTEKPDDFNTLAMYMINLSEYYKDYDEPEKAREVLEEMGEWVGKVGFNGFVCDYYLRIALVDFILKDAENGKKNIDRSFEYVPENIYPHPIYDDLRQISHFLVKSRDKNRADKIHELMKNYAQNNPGTLEQLIAYRTMAEYYAEFGDEKLALEYYSRLDGLFETRLNEFQKIQLIVHDKMKIADREILKLNRKIEESEELAAKEPLTQLLNRATLLKVASEFIEVAAGKKEKVGAIFIDIDYFKECNDTYGHVKGDEILKEVAEACRKEETSAIRFARYGGDEFFGITHGLEDKELTDIAARISERIRKADIPNEKNPNVQRVTLSIGVANVRIHDHNDTIIEIANYADKAVYYSKNVGRNCIHLLEHGDKDESEARFVRIDF